MPITQLSCPHRAKNFSYILTDINHSEAAIVDPSFCDELLTEKLTNSYLQIKYIINTHTHYDHTWGNKTLMNLFPQAKVAAYKTTDWGKDPESIALTDGDVLELGQQQVKIIHTPGHTASDICLHFENSILTGDTLFVGKVGGTENRETAWQQFESLNNLMKLPKHTEVLPGHDYGKSPKSTIEREMQTNPFCLRLDDFENFFWLKENWKSFKEQHGLS